MSIPQEFISELKMRSDIVDVISSYVKLKRSGRNYLGLCPFHGEKTPSFTVSPDKGFFYCFGCHVGGDVIGFIKQAENLDYVEAIKFLAQRAGMTVPENAADNGMSRLRTRLYEANRAAARFFNKQLYTEEGREGLDYLRGRRLSDSTITHFGLGYAPKSRFALVNHLKSLDFTKAEMIQANLANETRNGNAIDRFTDRVMFPIIDLRGNVIAFGGRTMMKDFKPKYLNTSDTPVFNKGNNLFALNFAKNEANGTLILVEGYMDVIALHQAGFKNTVAGLGTALTPEQANVIKHYCNEVILCYDSDNAGQMAVSRAIQIIRPTGLDIRVLTVPNGKDPDEFMKTYGEQGPARFRMLIEKSGNDVDFRLNKLLGSYNTELTDQRVNFLSEAAKLIAGLDSSIERDVYISKLAMEQHVSKDAIKEQVSRIIKKKSSNASKREFRELKKQMNAESSRISRENHSTFGSAKAEESLIALLMNNVDIAVSVFKSVPPELFADAFNKRVYETMKANSEQGFDFTLTDISGSFTDEENSRIAQILASHASESSPKQAADDYISKMRENAERVTPDQVAAADEDELRRMIENMKKKKS